MRLCALISLTSVSLNTPKTFERHPFLQYCTFCCDSVATLLFTSEMIAKIHIRGALRVSLYGYRGVCIIFIQKATIFPFPAGRSTIL